MDRRIDAGPLLVAAGALLLVVSLFLDWFGIPGRAGITGWEGFEVLDLVLLVSAVVAVAAAFGRLESRLLLGAAGVVALVVVSQLVEPPPAGQGTERETGAWLALAAAFLLAAGAALTLARIAVTVDLQGRERRRRVPADDQRDAAAEPTRVVAADAAHFAPPGATEPMPVDPDATQAFPAATTDPDRPA